MKRKWFAIFMAVGLLAGTASAQVVVNPMLQQGTQTFGINGSFDDDGDDFGATIGLSLGKFIMDYTELGVRSHFSFRGSDTLTIGLSVYGEQYFDIGSLFVPFVGASLGFGYWDHSNDDTTFAELQAYGGTRYFFVDHAAVGVDLVLKAATEDLYNKGQDSFDWQLRLHTKWFF